MKIAFVLDDVEKEKSRYTSVYLALKMHNKGHEVYLTDVKSLAYYPECNMGAQAVSAPKKQYESEDEYLKAARECDRVSINSCDLDVLFIRNNPSEAPEHEGWSQTAGAIFGQVATMDGVIVLNDPFTLSDSVNKMYFQQFPESVRPKCLISRNASEIKEFYKKQENKKMIIKPLQGSGGRGVFLVNEESAPNINSMIEANLRDGYVIAQEYIPEAAKGDIRLFMVNGKIFEVDGKVAAFHRFSTSGDARSNTHAGGSMKRAEITPAVRAVAERVRPKLVKDGVFICGLDIAGDKLIETNIFSPGGLNDASGFEGIDFGDELVKIIEKKLEFHKIYGNRTDNKLLNTL